jgi:hypothetical protein
MGAADRLYQAFGQTSCHAPADAETPCFSQKSHFTLMDESFAVGGSAHPGSKGHMPKVAGHA